MRKQFVAALALVFAVTAPTYASTIDFVLTFTITDGPGTITPLGFNAFISANNNYPLNAQQFDAIAGSTMSGGLLPSSTPGVTRYGFETNDIEHMFFAAYGFVNPFPSPFLGIFMAEPAEGHVPDSWGYGYGPAWVPLAGLKNGALNGDLLIFYGYPRGYTPDNTNPLAYSWGVGSWNATAVPEPATGALLLGGLVALRRRFQQRNG